ncbi:MAG: multicopper polyphenol oxidase [Bacilli bacterium]|nr:multicopper polyphenol oxidase [Bacilli bacterium]
MEPFVNSTKGTNSDLLFISAWQTKFPNLRAGFSSRLGGVSQKPFDSLNCGLHVADLNDDVVANRTRVAAAIDFPIDSWTYGNQVHGCHVKLVTSLDKGKGIDSLETAIQATDAFITQQAGICLGALFADCVPLYFYDPVHKAVGLAHAGWKGTVLRVAAATIAAMRQSFGSMPSDINATIGPSIGVCCFEVDEKVMDKVKSLDEVTTGYKPVFKKKENGKFMLNLQQLNQQIMIKAGISPSNIEVSELCTSCRTDLFFSHRKENGKTGRMVAWIGLT